jgi:uncharacterized phage-associated protein
MINAEKYRNVILYFCKSLGGSLRGRKKLAKLLYFADFDRFEYKESMKSITGDSYRVLKMGPVPDTFKDITQALARDGALEILNEDTPYDNLIEIYSLAPGVTPDMSVFDADEWFILDRVVKKYGALNGGQLADLTHTEAPFLATEPNDPVAFELAFYRGTDFDDIV